MESLHSTLRDKGHISDDQFERLEVISSGKVISLFHELRLGLYLGILLFTGGVGYIVYQHMTISWTSKNNMEFSIQSLTYASCK